MQPTCDSRLWLKSSEPAIPPTKRYVKPPQSWPSSHPRWLYLIHIFVLIPSARSPLKPPDPMNGLVFAYPNLKSPRGRGEARRGWKRRSHKSQPPDPLPRWARLPHQPPRVTMQPTNLAVVQHWQHDLSVNVLVVFPPRTVDHFAKPRLFALY